MGRGITNYPYGTRRYGAAPTPAQILAGERTTRWQFPWHQFAMANPATSGLVEFGSIGSNTVSPGTEGAHTNAVDADAMWVNILCNGAGTPGGFIGGKYYGGAWTRVRELPYYDCLFKSGAAADIAGNNRFFFGFTNSIAATFDNDDTLGTLAVVGVRFSVVAGDLLWTAVAGDAAGNQTLATIAGTSLAALTIYRVTVQVLTTALFRVTVNGKSATLAIPAAVIDTNLGARLRLGSDVNTKNFKVASMYVDRQQVNTLP
jgi:hypothetical protein